MKKLDLRYKLTKLKWQIETLINRLSFRSLLFICRLKRIFIRKDAKSSYPHLYYHNIDSYKIGKQNCTEIPDLSRLVGFKPDNLFSIYGRLIK